MTVTASDIGWSSYSSYEGPFFRGRQAYVLPPNPSENDKVMKVITAAEGGHYDAINMYDSGIVSVGLIQWIDAGQHSVDNMLGHVAEVCGIDKVTGPLAPALAASNATFKKDQKTGLWRFFDAGGTDDIITNDEERRLFMKGCGLKGSWTAEARLHAKTWAACLANVWVDAGARQAQIDYTVPRLKSFLASDVRAALYDAEPNEGWVGAVRAALIQFAVNLPATVATAYRAYKSAAKKWGPDWSIGLIKAVTTAGPATLWAARYNAIRPILESLYNVNLPATAKDLAAWTANGSNISSTLAAPDPVADPRTPIATVPSLPGEKPADKLIRLVKQYVGCSLTARRDELGELVSRGVDKPEAVVTIATNCATSALGIMAKAGVKHKLLNQPYANGMAIAWVRQIGLQTGALVKFDGKTMPKPGSLMRYNTPGTNNDHVEWLLGPVAADGTAEHGGGGRADNAITSGTGDIRSSWGRPMVEWLDPDRLGIDINVALPVPVNPPETPVPDPEPVQEPEPPKPEPEPPSPDPIVPVNNAVPAWKSIWSFFLMLINIFFTRGK